MNSISPSVPVVSTAPKLPSKVNGDNAEWKRIASIVAVIAISVMAFCIALGVTLTSSVFAVIGSVGAASIIIGGTGVVLGISLIVRHVLTKRNEPVTEPPKPVVKTPEEKKPPIKVETPKAVKSIPDVAPTPQKTKPTPKTPPPSTQPQKFVFNTPTKPQTPAAPMSTPKTVTPTVPPSPASLSKKTGKASLVQGLRDQKTAVNSLKTAFDKVATDTTLTDEEKAKAFYQKGLLALTQKDYKDALSAFEEAAKLEHDASMVEIGKLYFAGDGVDHDIEKALEWYEKAHELGNVDAAKKLANIYKKGLGVPKDEAKGEQYLAEIV